MNTNQNSILPPKYVTSTWRQADRYIVALYFSIGMSTVNSLWQHWSPGACALRHQGGTLELLRRGVYTLCLPATQKQQQEAFLMHARAHTLTYSPHLTSKQAQFTLCRNKNKNTGWDISKWKKKAEYRSKKN